MSLTDLEAAATVGLARSFHGGDTTAFCDLSIVASVEQRAGRMAPTLDGVPPPVASPAGGAACSRTAARLLDDILATRDVGLVLEWAELAREQGVTAPPSLLPSLLNIAAMHGRTRETIEPILGERGLWLAAQREPWRAAVPSLSLSSARARWETATRHERFMALSSLRRHDPAEARAMVESSWASLSATDRAEAVLTLAERLSMDDEPFLERCLDDRAGSVQRAAVQLLATLPASRLAARVRARLAACLVIQPGALAKWRTGARKGTLAINKPATCDASMRRDGVSPRFSAADASSRFGIDPDDAKAWREDEDWWVLQMIATAPPGAALADPPPQPSDVILAAMAMPDGHIALTGWRAAAVLHRDEAWAAALLETWCLPSAEGAALESLWSVLTPAQRERFGPIILTTRGFKSQRLELALNLLDPRCVAFSRACLESLVTVKRGFVDFERVARGVHRATAVDAIATIERIQAAGGHYTSHVASRVLPLRARLAEVFPS